MIIVVGVTPPSVASAQNSMSGFQQFGIQSVLDTQTGEQLSAPTAIARGIVDNRKQLYRNSLTHEIMPLDVAVRRSK